MRAGGLPPCAQRPRQPLSPGPTAGMSALAFLAESRRMTSARTQWRGERPPAGICWRSRAAANRCAGTAAMRAGALRTACDAAPARAPVTSRMRSSWFMVDVPGNSGLPPSSSPRMHPARAPALASARRRICRRLSAVAHACTCGAAGRQCASRRSAQGAAPAGRAGRTGRPHVHAVCIPRGAQQDLRRAVPAAHTLQI
jgi:hypothetical protein